jgi:tripartite-type tricarboxylate transporter receptor subunit TctC
MAVRSLRQSYDGGSKLCKHGTNAVNATLYPDLQFNFIRDIAPVAGLSRSPCVMEVNPSFPAKTVPEFIAYAKANPCRINMASAGNGTTTHMAGELFKMMAGVNLIHVPYRGSPQAITDLLGGQVQVMFDVMASSIEQIRIGKLRALAVTTATRSDALPGIPTVGEFVSGYEAISWSGIGAPKNTPDEIIEKLSTTINATRDDPSMKVRFADFGTVPMSMSHVDFRKFIADETEEVGEGD